MNPAASANWATARSGLARPTGAGLARPTEGDL